MRIDSFNSKIIIRSLPEQPLQEILEELNPSKLFVLVDDNTEKYCLPNLYKLIQKEKVYVKTIKHGEANKNMQSVSDIWEFLVQNKCDRDALMINLGGGMVLDIGGFVASTFKRGIPFIHIPTTLLSMVDASVGGKTGFNFEGYKNLIGVFNQPAYVLISTEFLRTLDRRHFYSGWTEMLKHGLIRSGEHLQQLLKYDPGHREVQTLSALIKDSIQIKNYFVENDPYENKLRKALNFGHTIGHAMESYSFHKKPLLHGEAIAAGMICELFISTRMSEFPDEIFSKVRKFILSYYPKFSISNDDQRALIAIMGQDKKNKQGRINFTLLKDIGQPQFDQFIAESEVMESLTYYSKLQIG